MPYFSSLFLRLFVVGQRKSVRRNHDHPEETNESTSVAKRYSWDEIQNLTVNFSQLIGTGGFSNVYLGRLSKKHYSAVKIHCDGERLHGVFRQELDILLRLQHDCIVKLLGYCDNQGVKFMETNRELWCLSMLPMVICTRSYIANNKRRKSFHGENA
ncbi:hypothetical protein ACFE04_024924 [Oxalis oulophora]